MADVVVIADLSSFGFQETEEQTNQDDLDRLMQPMCDDDFPNADSKQDLFD